MRNPHSMDMMQAKRSLGGRCYPDQGLVKNNGAMQVVSHEKMLTVRGFILLILALCLRPGKLIAVISQYFVLYKMGM